MNIVVINHYAGSPLHGMEYRPYYLAREWVRAGHSVTILTAMFSHVRTHNPSFPVGSADASFVQWLDGIEYRWYSVPSYEGNGLGRVRNIAIFLWHVWRDLPLLALRRPDAVIASSTYPMDIWVARSLARRTGAKLIFEVHDLWPLSPIEIGGMSSGHPFIRICQAAEDAAYRDADLVVSMLPKVHAHATSKGLPADRLAIVPNGVTLDEWQDGQAAPLRADVRAAIKAAHAAGERVVAYTGSHGLPNALDTLLDAAALLRNEPLRFILVGDGHERARLLGRVQSEGLARVEMFTPVPKSQIPSLLASVDMAYLGAPRHGLYRFGVAMNKMFDYMMARVPILYAVEAGNDPIGEAECGLSIAAENPSALAEAIRRLAALPDETLRSMGENGRHYVLSRHTYDVLANYFLDSIVSVDIRS